MQLVLVGAEREFPKEGVKVRLKDGRVILLKPPFLLSFELIDESDLMMLLEKGWVDFYEIEV